MTKLHHTYIITALSLLAALTVSQFMIWEEQSHQSILLLSVSNKTAPDYSLELGRIERAIGELSESAGSPRISIPDYDSKLEGIKNAIQTIGTELYGIENALDDIRDKLPE